jgi:hypothetical protein
MRIRRSIDVIAAATDAWALLADGYGDIGDWTTVVDSSHLIGDRVEVGAERRCQVSGPGTGDGHVVERITALDSDSMTYAYELVHGPSYIKSARNVVSVTALASDRCRIQTDGRITLARWLVPLSPFVSLAMRLAARSFLRDLQRRLEHGSPHPDVVAAGGSGLLPP